MARREGCASFAAPGRVKPDRRAHDYNLVRAAGGRSTWQLISLRRHRRTRKAAPFYSEFRQGDARVERRRSRRASTRPAIGPITPSAWPRSCFARARHRARQPARPQHRKPEGSGLSSSARSEVSAGTRLSGWPLASIRCRSRPACASARSGNLRGAWALRGHHATSTFSVFGREQLGRRGIDCRSLGNRFRRSFRRT